VKVAKSQPHNAPERYEDIVRRLNEVVQLLESSDVPCKACDGTGTIDGHSCTSCGGQGREALPLEESLKAFEEGISLVRRGEAKLSEAEKRVELLLNDGDDSRQAFDPERTRAEGTTSAPAGEVADRPRSRKVVVPEDDVPF
jgi:exodeoxyribonuclease VII small subunit